jgi:PASTA domain
LTANGWRLLYDEEGNLRQAYCPEHADQARAFSPSDGTKNGGSRLTRLKPKSVYSAIAAGLGLVAVIISITLGVRQLIPDAKPPHLSAVFVLDASDAMHAPFGDTTKLAAAQNSILQNVASFPGVSTSLRLVTGGCESEYTDPTIGFATKNVARYKDVFRNLATEPMSSYLEGLNSAANDLKTKKLIQDSEQKLLLVFVAGSSVACQSFLLPVGEGVSLQLFWLGSSRTGLDKVQGQLKDLGFTDIRVRKVGTKNELKAALNTSVRAVSQQEPRQPPPPMTTRDVPSVKGKSYDDASATLQASGFSVTRTDVDSSEASGIVVDQNPAANTSEPPGTTITLSVSKGPATLLTVPDVTGHSQDDASGKLEGSGFSPSVASTEVSDPGQAGLVQTQDPPGGTQAESGATVTITIGTYDAP